MLLLAAAGVVPAAPALPFAVGMLPPAAAALTLAGRLGVLVDVAPAVVEL
jgi:hypothetical protein